MRGVVWIVDGEHWPRAMLRAELIERGHEAVGFVLLRDALERLGRGPEPDPDVIVLELRGQRVTQEEADRLARSGIALIVLAGAVELNDPVIPRLKGSEILKRPVSIGEVADRVERRLALL
jgi:tRNA G37 N-methylase TrmD